MFDGWLIKKKKREYEDDGIFSLQLRKIGIVSFLELLLNCRERLCAILYLLQEYICLMYVHQSVGIFCSQLMQVFRIFLVFYTISSGLKR